MERHAFFDLEDTVINPVLNGWFNTQLINSRKVRTFMQEFKPDFVHVFSFAIWDQHQLFGFNNGTRERLERMIGAPFQWVPTVDEDIIPVCARILGMSPDVVTFQDASDFWGKHESFRLCMRHRFRDGSTPVELAFLDDAVYNENFEWPDLQVKGRILNIDQMYSDCPHEVAEVVHKLDLVDAHVCKRCGKVLKEERRS